MKTKESLIKLLQETPDTYISGSKIAESLGITRAAIWKCVRQLQDEGYDIDAVRSKGYRIGENNDVLNEDGIRKYLKNNGFAEDIFRISVRDEVTSTNDVLKEKAADLPGWSVVIANRQTRGKGRRSKSFYSPADTGLYLSILIKLPLSAAEATRITTAAAVAACRAIEKCTSVEITEGTSEYSYIKPQIKWVNDVYINMKKVCGILTEASISMENGGLDWAVMGIGFNIYEPAGGFPEDIADIAGAILRSRRRDFRMQTAAGFISEFYNICLNLGAGSMVEEYKKRSLMKGKQIDVIKGDLRIPAEAVDIDDDLRLLVRYQDGSTEALSSGDVSIKI